MSMSMHYHLEIEEYKELPLWVRLAHDLREIKTKNKIFEDKNLIYRCEELLKLSNISEYKDFFQNENTSLNDLVFEKIKQKNQTKLNVIEGVLSISREDFEKINIEESIEKLKAYYEKNQNVKIYSIAFHADEGHIDELTQEQKHNYHFHIIHSNITHAGRCWTKQKYKQSKNKGLSCVQSELALILGLERGESKEITQRDHINYKEYKEMKKQEKLELKKQIEKVKKLDIKDTTKYIESLKSWDIGFEKYKKHFFSTPEDYVKISKKDFENLQIFHMKMSQTYQEIQEYNQVVKLFQVKLKKFGIEDIKDIQDHNLNVEEMEKDFEIIMNYKQQLDQDIKTNEEKLKNINIAYENTLKEVDFYEKIRKYNSDLIDKHEEYVQEKKNILSELDKKIEKMSNQSKKVENNLIALANTHEKATLTIKNILEEERQKQINCEKMASTERMKIHKQAVQAEEEGKNDPEISLNKKWC